jgi:membrane-associated phospholipid phosphatase
MQPMIKAALLACLVLVTGAASCIMQGPVPGDIAMTKALQQALGFEPEWALWLTDTAKAPLLWGTMAVASGLAWVVAGGRAVLAVPLAYGLAFAADKALRAMVSVPRPDATVVAIAEPSSSSGLPSTFGLVYGAIFGVALLAGASIKTVLPARLAAAGLIVAGSIARVVLGGHWMSQMIGSVALGLLLALGATGLTVRIPAADAGKQA